MRCIGAWALSITRKRWSASSRSAHERSGDEARQPYRLYRLDRSLAAAGLAGDDDVFQIIAHRIELGGFAAVLQVFDFLVLLVDAALLERIGLRRWRVGVLNVLAHGVLLSP